MVFLIENNIESDLVLDRKFVKNFIECTCEDYTFYQMKKKNKKYGNTFNFTDYNQFISYNKECVDKLSDSDLKFIKTLKICKIIK